MNYAILTGRLTSDPEIRYSDSNICVAKFCIAVDRRFKKEGGQDADFINCTAFRSQAEFIEKYIRKGMKVGISGEIQTGSYTNRNGDKVKTFDIIVNAVESLERRESSEPQERHEARPEPKTEPEFVPLLEENLPFNTTH